MRKRQLNLESQILSFEQTKYQIGDMLIWGYETVCEDHYVVYGFSTSPPGVILYCFKRRSCYHHPELFLSKTLKENRNFRLIPINKSI